MKALYRKRIPQATRLIHNPLITRLHNTSVFVALRRTSHRVKIRGLNLTTLTQPHRKNKIPDCDPDVTT